MLKTLKVASKIVKAESSKSVPDIIKAGTATVGLVNKLAKKKKKTDEKKNKQRARG